MKYQELLILLPCHSLEDFPTYPEGEDAQSLLSSWSALWHPALLASAGQAPTWRRIEDPPQDVKDRLIVVPSVCVPRLPTGFSQRVKDEGGCIVRKSTSRREIIEAALAPLGDAAPHVEPELAADFLALGYCYLMIELLTRQMRYSSNLDEAYFKGQAVGAAVAAVEGNVATAKERLHACFSVLAEERDHYYPVDAFLLDLNLVASTTLGGTLRQELAQPTPTNLLVSAALLSEMQQKEPASLEALRGALAQEKVGLIGGEEQEERLPLLSQESILVALRHGLQQYESLLGQRPEVYGRWRFGLTPTLPGILHKLGFRGALHACFEEGGVPSGTQFKVRWEGIDGSVIDAIARPPLDASKPQTFLSLATKLGESMDSDHVATLCLAHWPGQASEWLGDLKRLAGYSKALGKFITVQQYFRETDLPGHLDRFEADRYRSPYLKQAVIRKQENPISTSVRYWQSHYQQRAEQALRTLTTLVAGRVPMEQCGVRNAECGMPPTPHSAFRIPHSESPPDPDPSSTFLDSVAAVWAESLAGGKRSPRGCLILNPCSFVRRVGVELPADAPLPDVQKPVYAADAAGDRRFAVVDLPPSGFVWLGSDSTSAARDKKALVLVEDNSLRNEFFEAAINPTTGALATLYEYQSRGNRLSQQVALRMPGPKQRPGDTHRDPDESASYSVMAADALEVTCSTAAMGEIVVRGRLLDLRGEKLAGFVQTYRVWRGSRVLQIEVELDPIAELKPDPWNSYFCCRFAWADEAADLFRTVNETRQSASGQRFESPHYIEIGGDKHTTTILAGGLPFHRRHESRMLDCLLISRGESQRKFRLGVGLDLTHPMLDAISLLAPPLVVPDAAQPTSGTSGWLFHIDSRNVIATHWEPVVQGTSISGFRVRLLETAGRPANLTLSAFRPVKSAQQVDFRGQPAGDCTVTDGKVRVDLPAHGWTEVLAYLVERPTRRPSKAVQRDGPGMPSNMPMIVTIDGPAGAGKSSVARELARRLGFQFLDTGAMYRAVALAALRAGLGDNDADKIADLAERLHLEFQGDRVLLDGLDVTNEIRTSEVAAAVHLAADNPRVRARLVELQRQIASLQNTVTEGRDQGTVAFPNAECKFFLTASPAERARRRHAELAARGEAISFDEVLAQQTERDRRDAIRPVGALVKAADAIEVLTDWLTAEQVVDRLETIVRNRVTAIP